MRKKIEETIIKKISKKDLLKITWNKFEVYSKLIYKYFITLSFLKDNDNFKSNENNGFVMKLNEWKYPAYPYYAWVLR